MEGQHWRDIGVTGSAFPPIQLSWSFCEREESKAYHRFYSSVFRKQKKMTLLDFLENLTDCARGIFFFFLSMQCFALMLKYSVFSTPRLHSSRITYRYYMIPVQTISLYYFIFANETYCIIVLKFFNCMQHRPVFYLVFYVQQRNATSVYYGY